VRPRSSRTQIEILKFGFQDGTHRDTCLISTVSSDEPPAVTTSVEARPAVEPSTFRALRLFRVGCQSIRSQDQYYHLYSLLKTKA
jgi:hypothetical protein